MSELRQKNPQLYDFLAKNFENSPNRQKDFADLQARMQQVESYPPPRPFPAQQYDRNSTQFVRPDAHNYKQQEHNDYMKRYLNDAVRYYADSIGKLDKQISKSLQPKKERKKKEVTKKIPKQPKPQKIAPIVKPTIRKRKQENPQKSQQIKNKKSHARSFNKIKEKAKH